MRLLFLAMLAALGGCAMLQPPALPPAGGGYVVFFKPWSAGIDDPATAVIATAAKAAAANPNAAVTVIGAADGVGGSQANVDLSETRAQVVADALMRDGVAFARIHQVSQGSQGPTSADEQFYRRVLIRIGGK